MPSPAIVTPLSLHLHNSGESFYHDIRLENGQLTYQYFNDDEQRCAQWMKSEPCWTMADLQTLNLTLDSTQQAALVQVIETSGLLTLAGDTFGATNLRERAYSERLVVKLGTLERKLTYRSTPDAEAKPLAFSQLETALTDYLPRKGR